MRRNAFDIEVNGQHASGGYLCAGCGCDYGCFTMGCRQCRNRHGWRRRRGTVIEATPAPTSRVWFYGERAA